MAIDRSVVTHPSSSYARRCLTRLSRDNRRSYPLHCASGNRYPRYWSWNQSSEAVAISQTLKNWIYLEANKKHNTARNCQSSQGEASFFISSSAFTDNYNPAKLAAKFVLARCGRRTHQLDTPRLLRRARCVYTD
ncbi:hypothetical protein J6590_068426 [Homalodisca vitripennis]|nr:hypothetical protein J6590_068426 [Homalodisca vitripennis]